MSGVTFGVGWSGGYFTYLGNFGAESKFVGKVTPIFKKENLHFQMNLIPFSLSFIFASCLM